MFRTPDLGAVSLLVMILLLQWCYSRLVLEYKVICEWDRGGAHHLLALTYIIKLYISCLRCRAKNRPGDFSRYQ